MLYPRRALLRLLLVLSMVVLGGAATLPDATLAQSNGQGPLNHAFQQASKEFDVPRDLLVTIAYAETHFDDHAGQPSVDNGYGLMHLVENSQTHTLTQAAALLGVSPEVLKTDTPQNIRGGAALLRTYANEQGLNDLTRKDMTEWHPVVARYSNATMEEISTLYADEAYTLLNNGISGKSKNGEEIEVIAKDIKPKKNKPKKPQGNGETLSLSPQAAPAEYAVSPEDADLFSSDATAAATLWAPAAVGNYTPANRESDYPINYVVIHTTQGSYSSAINWFQNPASRVSAHYVIRSSDGRVTQTVSEKNIAHHAGNWTYNTQSIGIEHEGYVSNPSWYTDAMYRASAALTRSICQRYGIPMTRARIIGHNEVPGATHTDPGPYWNWNYYMQLVQGTAWSTTIDNATSGRFTASSNWSTSSYSSYRYGSNYRFAQPQAVNDAAWFKASLPTTANYEVMVWYPANEAYNPATPFIISTSSGNRTVYWSQRTRGGQWVSLGTYNFNAGDRNVVGVSRWSNSAGYVIADAVRLIQR